MAGGATEQLHVLARYSDGSIRDVTRLSDFQSSEQGVVSVESNRGLLKAGSLSGESTVMVRYMNHIAVWNTAIPASASIEPCAMRSCHAKTSSTRPYGPSSKN